jgi:hypothetical protein
MKAGFKILATAVALLAMAAPDADRNALATDRLKPYVDCRLTSCKRGGRLYQCYSAMQREANAKSKSCSRIEILSGYSAYTTIYSIAAHNRKLCIKPSSVLYMHLAARASDRMVLSFNHPDQKFLLTRSGAIMSNYLRVHGGFNKRGLTNAMFLTPIPATKTGIRLCK